MEADSKHLKYIWPPNSISLQVVERENKNGEQ
jgi:hypothetical protein